MAVDIEKLAQLGSMAAGGGYAQAALGGLQAVYGLTQLPKAKAEFERARASAPSLETPSQFYENYKNAYDSELARMQSDAIQANLATSVQALQGAGGRALVGGLGQATAQSQMQQNQMLAQERQMRMAAGQQLAQAEERTIGRKEARSQQEMAYANQAYQAALGNIGGGLASAGEGLMYGMSAAKGKTPKEGAPATQVSPKQIELEQQARVKEIGDTRNRMAQEKSIVPTPESPLTQLPQMNLPMHQEGLKTGKMPLTSNPLLKELNADVTFELDELPYPDVNAPRAFSPTVPEPPLASAKPMTVYQGAGQAQLRPITQQRTEIRDAGFENLFPVSGNPIPSEYRNDQAMKQINAFSKMYTQFAPALGRMTSFRNGGMMTQGAFNHDTNPIDIVQNGQKVGEATGGEYILNPEQAASIAKQSSYAKKLFKKFERNAKKNK